MKSYKKTLAALSVSAAFVLSACSDNDNNNNNSSNSGPTQTIAEIVVEGENFTVLEQALLTADDTDNVVALLTGNDAGPYTVFAPTDAAFTALLGELNVTAEELLADPDLAEILRYHVLSGSVDSTAAISVASGDDKQAATANTNGDAVTVTLNSMDELFINTSKVTQADVQATNGVVHVIDEVLLPSAFDIDTTNSGSTIAEIVTSLSNSGTSGEFTSLYNALVAANSNATVSALLNSTVGADVTVFAPTDAAFAQLLTDLELADLDALVTDLGVDGVAEVLLDHVVVAEIDKFAALKANGGSVTSAGSDTNNTLAVEIVDAGLTVGGSTVVTANIEASDGIIHIIDKVIVLD